MYGVCIASMSSCSKLTIHYVEHGYGMVGLLLLLLFLHYYPRHEIVAVYSYRPYDNDSSSTT
jgi:hypothetical protein